MADLQETISRISARGFPCPSDCSAQFSRYQEGARRRGYAFDLTIEQARAMFTAPCMYCHLPPRGRFNGIDRVDNSKGYSGDNCVPCCPWCNRAKADSPLSFFMEWIWWMRPELRPKRAPETLNTRIESGIRYHNSFTAFPVCENVEVSIKSAQKLVDIITTYQKSTNPDSDLAA